MWCRLSRSFSVPCHGTTLITTTAKPSNGISRCTYRNTLIRYISSSQSSASDSSPSSTTKTSPSGGPGPSPPPPPLSPPSPPRSTVDVDKLITYKDVKKVLLKKSWFVRLATALAVLAALGLITRYSMSWNDTPEEKLQKALQYFEYDDVPNKELAFEFLKRLFVTKRVFSGPVDIPVSDDALITETLIQNLVNTLSKLPSSSLSWIYRLMHLSKEKSEKILLSTTTSIEDICNVLEDDYSTGINWILAARVLLSFQDAEVLASHDRVINCIELLLSSSNPLAMVTACLLSNKVGPVALQKLDSKVSSDLSQINKPSMQPLYEEAILKCSDRYLLPSGGSNSIICEPRGPASSLVSILVFSTFASVWGNIMWRVSIALSSSYRALVSGQDPKRVRTLYKQFLRSRSVGRAVFILLTFDHLSSRLMQHADGQKLALNKSSPIPFSTNYNVPLSSLFPFVQTSLFTLGTICAIRTQRFVVVPLLLAGAYHNIDFFEKFIALQPFVKHVKLFDDVPSNFELFLTKHR